MVHQHAFDQIKLHVSNDVKLQFYDANKLLYIEVDTSKKGIGAVMLQGDSIVPSTVKSDEILMNLRPISYASKTLSSTKSNYSNIEHELLGLLFTLMHFKHFTYGRLVHVITDHKLLVSLFRKSLVDSSPRLTRMLIQLLDYTLDMRYQPGAQMHLSDAISRLLTHNSNTGSTIENLDVSVHTIEELTGFNSLSVAKIHQHTTTDLAMQQLIQHINDGFPNSSAKCPETIHPFFSFRDELSVCNGIVLKGHNRIVVPESLRAQAVNLLHNKAHLGLNKTLEHACTCMYLPSITDARKNSISACKVCLTFSDKQQHELYSADTVTRLWSYLSLDNFEFQGQHYIMILDILTKFIVVRMVQSLSMNCTTQIFTLVFSEHGLRQGQKFHFRSLSRLLFSFMHQFDILQHLSS